jgi:hypothetical protein
MAIFFAVIGLSRWPLGAPFFLEELFISTQHLGSQLAVFSSCSFCFECRFRAFWNCVTPRSRNKIDRMSDQGICRNNSSWHWHSWLFSRTVPFVVHSLAAAAKCCLNYMECQRLVCLALFLRCFCHVPLLKIVKTMVGERTKVVLDSNLRWRCTPAHWFGISFNLLHRNIFLPFGHIFNLSAFTY